MSVVAKEPLLIRNMKDDEDLENISDCWSRDFDYVNYIMFCKNKGLTPVSVLKYNLFCELLSLEHTEVTEKCYGK